MSVKFCPCPQTSQRDLHVPSRIKLVKGTCRKPNPHTLSLSCPNQHTSILIYLCTHTKNNIIYSKFTRLELGLKLDKTRMTRSSFKCFNFVLVITYNNHNRNPKQKIIILCFIFFNMKFIVSNQSFKCINLPQTTYLMGTIQLRLVKTRIN